MYRTARVYSAKCPVERRNEVTDNKAAMFVFFFVAARRENDVLGSSS